MFIQTETTPNPQTLKFLPGRDILGAGTAFLTSIEEAKTKSPLAEALFRAESAVTAVFLGSDFITITKAEGADWNVLKPALLTVIMDHLVAGKPIVHDTPKAAVAAADESEIVTQIKELIETRVRPAVAMDGGDIIFRGFHDGIVELELHGSCSGCPSSTVTLKNGIENMLKHYIPEVISVEAVS